MLPNPLTIPGLEHGRAEFNDIWLHYVRGGKNLAQPIILLHGFPQSWVMWRLILPDLMERHHVVATLRSQRASRATIKGRWPTIWPR